MFDGSEYWCKIWRKTDLCFLKFFVCKLKNRKFIVKSKMAEIEWRQNLLIYFENCKKSILMSWNRMMKIFIMVNITPTCKRCSWDKSMLFHSKKALLLPTVWPGTEYTWALIWKKSLLIYVESYQVFSILIQAE